MSEHKGFSIQMAAQFKKEGQNLRSFMDEIGELDEADRLWYWERLNAEGYPTGRPKAPKDAA